jgi:hypothetical protein
MTATLFVSQPTILSPSGCGCGGVFLRSGDAYATCSVCSEPVSIYADITPYLADDERLVWVADSVGRDVLAYFAEMIESDEENES